MRTPRIALVATALIVAAGGAGCGQPGNGPPVKATPNTPRGSATASPTVDDPSARANRVADFARQQYPDSFAGVALDDSGEVVRVYRTPDGDLDQAVTAAFPGVSLEFVDAVRTERELDEVVQEILGSMTHWEEQGVRLHGVGADFVNGRVRVISPDTALAADLLTARYGEIIEVVAGDVVHPTITAESRR